MIDVGLAFFPDVDESERSAVQYYKQCLDFVELGDQLGFHHVRIVEHYFRRYGGYSPNPIVFLAAAAQRSRRLKLITGAVLPAFNHPLKLAGEIGMLDAISGGRAEIGFARAFLPHEFERFGVDIERKPGPVQRGRPGRPGPAGRGGGGARRQVPPFPADDLPAPADATPSPAALDRSPFHGGDLPARWRARLRHHGPTGGARLAAEQPRYLPESVEGGRTSRRRSGHARLPHAVHRGRGDRRGPSLANRSTVISGSLRKPRANGQPAPRASIIPAMRR